MTLRAQTGMNRWLVRLARLLPVSVLEQPWAIFIKGLCIVSGLTTVAGPVPGSIQTTMPRWMALAWALTLVCGAGAGLWGLLQPRWWRVELAGLIWLGTAALAYGLTIWVRFGMGGAIAGGIVFAFGLAALVRALAVYVSLAIARGVTRSPGST